MRAGFVSFAGALGLPFLNLPWPLPGSSAGRRVLDVANEKSILTGKGSW